MTNQTTNQPKKIFTIPVAIILAGIIIAGAIIYTDKSRGESSEKGSDKEIAAPSRNQPGRPSEDNSKTSLSPITASDHIRGDKNALITLVEYSDLECPFCKRFHPTALQLIEEYEGQVKWVYRHFPLDSLHSKARKEAEATDCAAELGGNDKFWAYIDRLFEVTPSNNRLDLEQLPQIAQDVGLNRAKFENCLDSGRYAQHIQEDYQDAVSAGGSGTPYSVIIDARGNKTPVSGALPYAQLKQIIDSML